jgi:hypothetical protein
MKVLIPALLMLSLLFGTATIQAQPDTQQGRQAARSTASPEQKQTKKKHHHHKGATHKKQRKDQSTQN